jgi:thiol:disulfide interchange protein DsbD
MTSKPLHLLCFSLMLALWLATASLGYGEDTQEAVVVQVRPYLSHGAVPLGESFSIAVSAAIKTGFHINSHTPTDEFMVPTRIEFVETAGISFGPAAYPVPAMVSMVSMGKKRDISLYEGTIVLLATGRVSNDTPIGKTTVSGKLTYQACNNVTCFMPETVPFEHPLEVIAVGEKPILINRDVFEKDVSEKKAQFTAHEEHAKKTLERGMFYALWTFFLFGLGLNLTPCVYPVIPMTVGFFANQGKQSRGRTFFLAAIYVIGIAMIFSTLGLVSGLAGKQWGFLFQSPWFVIAVAVAILAMSASMFGSFEITVPSFLMQLGGKSRQGTVGAFVMGLTVGIVIAPCAAGLVLGLIGLVAKLGMVWKGTLFFFVMGFGLGLPYLFLAVFSGLMSRLPKSGMWMVWIRKLFGILLMGVALYFLVPQAKQSTDQQLFFLGVLGLFGGLFLGFLDSSQGYNRTFKVIRAVIGGLIMLVGAAMVQRAIAPAPEQIAWVHSMEEFRVEGKPLIVDFYADWCTACKELDRNTFADKKVMEKSKLFVMAKIDMTSPSAANSVMRTKFNVSGLPTVVFVGVDGVERKDLRIEGFVGPDEMLKKMQAALPGS